MHLTALVSAADHVCCRYRLAAYRPHLERAGHSLTLQPLPRSWWARWRLFRALRGQAVLLQRFLLPRWQLLLLRRNVDKLLFDFDDAVFLRDSYAPRGIHKPSKLRRFAATMSACDAVLAGNGFLAEQAGRYLTRERIHVVPTCVDLEAYPPRSAPGDGKTLVWIGTASTLKGVQSIAAKLDAVADRVPGVRLKVICDRFPTFARMPVVACRWGRATEAGDVVEADVGVSWLPDDDWSRGKCGLKILQYMAAGLPVVTNPIGVHPEMVRPGETGFLATTTDEWVDAIARLVADPELRQRMGMNGQRLVAANYHVAGGARQFVRVVERLAGRARLAVAGGRP